MSKLVPVNDYFLVEVVEEPYDSLGRDPEEGIRKGRVVDISKFLTYWGSHTYYFDSSADNVEMLAKVQDKYSAFVGKVVYWPERSEAGTIVEHGGKKYIFMKWASIMGVVEE